MLPNILLITADQMRGDAFGAAGHPEVQTPFIDTMAREGVRFANAYSACPTCIPARAALFTGLSQRGHRRVGYADGIAWNYPTTLPGTLAAAGYHTHCAGKMHVWPPRSLMGFHSVDLHDGFLPNRSAETPARDWWQRVDDYLPFLQAQLGPGADIGMDGIDCNSWVARPWTNPEHLHPTNWAAAQSIGFLRRRDTTKPFFLWASFVAPHPPYNPPQCYYNMYAGRQLSPPAVGEWAKDPGPPKRFDSFEGHLPPAQQHSMQAGYYGLITHMDHQIGRILRALKDEGVLNNTIILFTADHGEMLGDHHMLRKSQPFEGSCHVPLVVYDPGGHTQLAPGSVDTRLAELRDVMPTLLAAAGVAVPQGVEGLDLLGGAQRESLHGEHLLQYRSESAQFVLQGGYKYIWFSGSGEEMLFNLAEDPHELHNLAALPVHAATLKQLRGILCKALAGRPEGYSDGLRLFTGKTPTAYLG